MVSILWTATVTPFEVAFIAQGPGSSRIWLLYALNRMIDAVFVVDILLSFSSHSVSRPSRWGLGLLERRDRTQIPPFVVRTRCGDRDPL